MTFKKFYMGGPVGPKIWLEGLDQEQMGGVFFWATLGEKIYIIGYVKNMCFIVILKWTKTWQQNMCLWSPTAYIFLLKWLNTEKNGWNSSDIISSSSMAWIKNVYDAQFALACFMYIYEKQNILDNDQPELLFAIAFGEAASHSDFTRILTMQFSLSDEVSLFCYLLPVRTRYCAKIYIEPNCCWHNRSK